MTNDPQNVLEKVSRNSPSLTLLRHELGHVKRNGQVAAPKQTAGASSSPSSWLNYVSPCHGLHNIPGVKVTQGKSTHGHEKQTATAHLSPLGRPGDAGHGGLQGTDGNRQFVPKHSSPPDALTRLRPHGPRLCAGCVRREIAHPPHLKVYAWSAPRPGGVPHAPAPA